MRDWSNDPADLVHVMMVSFHIDRFTATQHLGHGRVTVAGRTISLYDARSRWRKRQVAGKLLQCPEGTVRLYGTSAATSEIVNEQLKLGRHGTA